MKKYQLTLIVLVFGIVSSPLFSQIAKSKSTSSREKSFLSNLIIGPHFGSNILGNPDLDTTLFGHPINGSSEANQGYLQEGKNVIGFLFRLDSEYRFYTHQLISHSMEYSAIFGIQYYQKGYTAIAGKLYTDPDDLIVKVGPSGRLKADYISFPLIAKASRLIKTSFSVIKPFITTGPEFDFLLSASFSVDQNNTTINMKEFMNAFYAYWLIGLGVDFDFPWGILTLDMRYQIGITSNKKINIKTSSQLDYPWDFTIPEYKQNNFLVTLGYAFKFSILGL